MVPVKRHYFAFCLLTAFTPIAFADMSVSVDPSRPSPAPLGTVVTWQASVSGDSPGTLWYRFRARRAAGDFHIIRDYGPLNSLNWTNINREGMFEIEISVRNRDTGETVASTASFELTPLATGDTPVITPTGNPLVFLYSAPACPVGSRMRVQLRPVNGVVEHTHYKACSAGGTMNFYLAGLQPSSQYSVKHVLTAPPPVDGQQQDAPPAGPLLQLDTPSFAPPDASYQVLQGPGQPPTMPVLLQSPLNQATIATDLYGKVLWYYTGDLQTLTRAGRAGTFYGFSQFPSQDASRQFVRKFDLLGMTLLETNAARINEQLADMGRPPITAFHHEVSELPDGKLLVLANTERLLTNVQGPGEIDVLGDMILVLDKELQVVWLWDAFEHLDPYRKAPMNEICTPNGGGCPPFYLAPQANDWLHGNGLDLLPDGNLLYSVRHQDWIVKIDYSNGQGSGDIIWRLGKDGDFSLSSSDMNDWFSHQHDPQGISSDGLTMLLFDNGNERRANNPSAHSRGQVLQLNEQARTATLTLNVDVGSYSPALGAAQKLSNGNFHFLSGYIGSLTSESLEVDPSGNIVYRIQTPAQEYRSFRMRDLYTPPD